MDIEQATMTVDPYEAQKLYRAYWKAIKNETATRDDVMLYKGYRALVRGQKVIDINLAIGAGGIDAQRRPRLAVCQADASQVRMTVWGDGVRFTHRDMWHRLTKRDLKIPLNAFPGPPAIGASGTDMVPTIPPQYRPADDLAKYHLLWEAEWRPVPTGDPLLLKHIDGPFYVVLAAWNLTPLEQAVMRQRL